MIEWIRKICISFALLILCSSHSFAKHPRENGIRTREIANIEFDQTNSKGALGHYRATFSTAAWFEVYEEGICRILSCEHLCFAKAKDLKYSSALYAANPARQKPILTAMHGVVLRNAYRNYGDNCNEWYNHKMSGFVDDILGTPYTWRDRVSHDLDFMKQYLRDH
jgi:hypothetical protein